MSLSKSMRLVSLAWCFMTAMSLAHPAYASRANTDEGKVVEAVRLMYVALTNDDPVQFRAVTSPDFYAFDIGKRMTGDQLIGFAKSAHAAGKIYVWQVTEPQVYVDGNTAWVTYVNRGSVQDAAGKQALRWLESAVLRKEDGTWRIHFFHSTRAN